MRSKRWSQALIVVFILGGVWSLARLFEISTSGGTIFPAYSSLRADPQGTKALYDALGRINGFRVERSFEPWPTFDARDAAVLILNEPIYTWRVPSQVMLTDYEKRASAGARLIVALRGEGKLAPLPPNLKERNVLADRWRIRIEQAKNGKAAAFVLLDDSWKVLQEIDGQPAAIERKFGTGVIALVNDSFAFSNEALRSYRETSLLLALLGERRHVIFEESHLGTVLTGSVGQLLRRYHLESAAMTLVLLALLFIWRNSSTLVPSREDTHSDTIQGRGEDEALTSLLRRGISPDSAPGAVLGIWKKSATMLPAVGADRRARIEKELEEATGKDLLATWQRAHELTHKRS